MAARNFASVKLGAEFVDEARNEAESFNRCVAGQIEHWARLGLALECAGRVAHGGHPAPKDRTGARYERNRPLIREAILSADRGYVFDSSGFGRELGA